MTTADPHEFIPTNNLSIRAAYIADSTAIFDFIRGVAYDCLGVDAEALVNTISPASVELNIQNMSYVLGIFENEIVGVAAMRDRKHFYHLFVAHKHQYKGIAKSLWHHLKADAVANGTNIFTVNSSLYAVPVYEKFGFSATSEAQTRNGINYVPMRFDLA